MEKQVYNLFVGPKERYITTMTTMPNAKERQRFNYTLWCVYLTDCKGKNLEYSEDYYKYLRGVGVLRDLESHEQSFVDAYEWVVFDVRKVG